MNSVTAFKVDGLCKIRVTNEPYFVSRNMQNKTKIKIHGKKERNGSKTIQAVKQKLHIVLEFHLRKQKR